ncbi:hydroxymethylglutaryl-CoA lyase [Amycolatopsis sp. K13G38]|uniref:Hydroxymethylglutaryl-CoA lyase n=1 Tax=Amycolatopsis acididurans TaxID=2724524 RepID=A0ABX1IWT5_9PSEU|nr:hydroxymethylglutaryl-CoA lyase [Amycolatopsis acididurans]NKQ51928.1 hydroxymethylglutaryl-CoA lyase [Amycolatopsis acididurans]
MTALPAPPAQVGICECWARDGLQSWTEVVPTEGKIAVIEAVVEAGVRELDVTSLVPPKYAPQFADAEQVLEAIAGRGLRTRVLTPNLRGVQRAVELNERLGAITAIGFPISASEAHNLANLKRTHAEHLSQIEEMVRAAHEAGLETVSAVATAFGCPITGEVPEETVFDMAGRLIGLGVDRIMLSDTTGLADPVRAGAYTARAVETYPGTGWIAHFHDTRGAGIANTWAALLAGVGCIDSCLGGIGGEPSTVEQNHAGETGNVSTEDIVVLLERAGVRTGIDVGRLLAAGVTAERIQGAPGRSQVQRTGTGLAG